MLKARRRNRLATRFSTPGWSCTRATRVCFTPPPPPRPAGGPWRRGWPPRAPWDTRSPPSPRGSRRGRPCPNAARRRPPGPGPRAGSRGGPRPVGAGEEHEVGREHRGGRVALVVEELLPLPDHPEVAVVDDGDLDVELLLLQRGQLARRHLEPPVAGHDPHLGVGACHLGPDGGGQREAHGPQAAGGD